MKFGSIVLAALLSGLLSGVILALLHINLTSPIILHAEQFEQPEIASPDTASDHEYGGWQPADGLERTAFTIGADVIVAVGFACLMIAGFIVRGKTVTVKQAALFAFMGYAAFVLAPSFGLPPELPGTEAAPLLSRQIWWLGSAIATLAGLGIIFSWRKPIAVLLGILVLAAPHLIGAPMVENPGSTAPADLQHQFHITSLIVNAVFWLALGLTSGFFYQRFTRSEV